MNNPLVSIIIPTYNRAHLIGETLDSILGQTYTNWECIIVDDGSTDNTESVITAYIEKDSRIQFYHRPADRPKGGNAARNYGFELSIGEYVKWFDSDDIMHYEFIQLQIQLMISSPELDFCASLGKIFINKVGDSNINFYPRVLGNENVVYDYIVGDLYFATPAPLWRKRFLLNKTLFDDKIFRGQEADFNFRRLIEGAQFEYIRKVLFYVRRSHDSIESNSQNNLKSSQSQFNYFQNIFNYLNKNPKNIEMHKIHKLKKYILFRQMTYFSQIRDLGGFSTNVSNFKTLFCNLLHSKIPYIFLFRSLLGITSIMIFNKGYSLVYIKDMDIRTLPT